MVYIKIQPSLLDQEMDDGTSGSRDGWTWWSHNDVAGRNGSGLCGDATLSKVPFAIPLDRIGVARAAEKQRCEGTSELTGAVELHLFFWVVHLGVQINLGYLQRLVSEPGFDFHQIEAGAQPVRRRRPAKSVGIMFLETGRVTVETDYFRLTDNSGAIPSKSQKW
jgi:hypothetical protein